MAVTLLCTVRGCCAPLTREERRLICANGHAFDVARSGYANLLQPQDRRSRAPGDCAEAVAARRRFLDRGHAAPLVQQLVEIVGDAATILDVGCGEGHHLGAMRGRERHGVDISTAAIDAAARRDRDCRFVVANADRFLPYADASFEVVTSITARMNPPEFRRVLASGGRVVIAIPAPDDLIELREAILGEGVERDRVERTIEMFAGFTVARRERISTVATLDPQSIRDAMVTTYRAKKLPALEEMRVTLSQDVITFTRED